VLQSFVDGLSEVVNQFDHPDRSTWQDVQR
jgi:hypothetical protein